MTQQDTRPAGVATSHRLAAQPGEVIDRSSTLDFTWNGAAHVAHPGDTIVSSLAAAGVRSPDTAEGYYDKRYAHPDVLVAGGGPAGLAAALAAAEAGRTASGHQD